MKPVLALTAGEPTGIGPEIALRAAFDSEIKKRVRLVLIGNKAVFDFYLKSLKLPPLPAIDSPHKLKGASALLYTAKNLAFSPGKPTGKTGREAGRALDLATELALKKQVAGIVTAPIDKYAFNLGGYPYRGHTEYFLKKLRLKKTMMIFVGKKFSVALHSVHIPLKEAIRQITKKEVLDNLVFLDKEYKKYFRAKPRISVCGLNPHAGEGGLLGSEEKREIEPAIKSAKRRGVNVEGPFSADTIFERAKTKRADVIYAMYHDQGLIGIKAMRMFEFVNTTLGLPFIRTSPGHGTAYEIAGSGGANIDGIKEAILLAGRIAR